VGFPFCYEVISQYYEVMEFCRVVFYIPPFLWWGVKPHPTVMITKCRLPFFTITYSRLLICYAATRYKVFWRRRNIILEKEIYLEKRDYMYNLPSGLLYGCGA
jgi:hypothetical protein